jgi:hypothetical protein
MSGVSRLERAVEMNVFMSPTERASGRVVGLLN